MDEKEQADRLAAAEALYMISTRGTAPRISRRGRKKKKNNDYSEDITTKRKTGVGDVTVNSGNRRGGGNRGSRGGRGASGGGSSSNRGARNGRGGSSSPRGRAGSSKHRSQQRQSVEETLQQNNSCYRIKQSPSGGEMLPDSPDDSKVAQKSRSRTTKLNNQKTKSNSPSSGFVGYSHELEVEDKSHQAIGFTGAAISISGPTSKRSSFDFSQNLPSSGLVSGIQQQASLTSRTLSSVIPSYGLPSINLTSFTSELNLPSIPLEIGSLQLSSQPTPNLSSLGDMAVEGVMEDECMSADRKKSEKFLPLKKRKLHNPSDTEVQEPAPLVEASSLSESEDQPEPVSSPQPQTEPVRAFFTVQAPPIITMQTLMEIKTALTADDDGDLPLHIAVVHENMRMVTKLINLMRIAGKGVDKFNKQQQTPLHLAVKLNFLEAIDILLKSNANVNAVDCTGSSSIHMAVQGRSPGCLAMLLAKCPQADLNVRNFDGLTPLHIAVDNGDLQQVELLLKHNADIDVTDGKSGRTALFRAAESNQKSMVELLLSKGANPDVPNYAGVTTAMAAQGRNLHGVLKLLGAAATDKFSEYETKPSGITLESKPAPLYLGFQSSDKRASSPHVLSRSSSLSKQTGQEITCLIEPKHSPDTAEMPSNETKVFHNVFVFSQNQGKDKNGQTKSLSEPASPEVKMEVMEEKDGESFCQSGLMSLPEGIFSHQEEEKGGKPLVRHRRVTSVGQGGFVMTSQEKLRVPVYYSRLTENTRPVVQREGQKSVMLQIVHPPTSGSNSAAGIGSSVSSSVPAPPSDHQSKTLGLPSESVPPPSVPSSTTLSNTPPSSSDTVTLTGMQARLFQMLLKMYNIDPTNETSAGSSDGRQESGLLKPLQPVSSVTSSSVAASVTSLGLKQIDVTFPRGGQNSNSVSDVGSSHGFDPQAPSYYHIQTGRPSSGYEHRVDDVIYMDTEHVKSEDSPLNLSTSSNRQYSKDAEDREVTATSVRKLDVTGSASRTVYTTPSPGCAGDVAGVGPGNLSPIQVEPQKGKLISIGVRRISDGDRGGKPRSEGSDQYEMFLLPSSEQRQGRVADQSGSAELVGVTNVANTREINETNLSQGNVATKQLESILHGETSHVPSIKLTPSVRDYLSQHHQTFTISAKTMPSSVHSSVPTVLDVPAESSSSEQKKHVITLTRNPPAFVAMDKTSADLSSPVSSTLVLPATTSPVFLHQGQVIDLSRSSLTEASNSLAQHLSLPSYGTDSGQGRIIGFSGAILSVAPSKVDRSEKRLPKEAAQKETQKKRGRKSLKLMQGSSPAAETGLGKINSETDEKLKKFLGAKKQENSLPNLPHTVGLQLEQTNGADMEESVDLEVRPEAERQADKAFKTVGIFSGDIQHVKVGKKFVMPPSPLTLQTAPISLSTSSLLSSSPSSVGYKLMSSPSPVIKSEDIDDTEKGSTLSSAVASLVTATSDAMGRSYIKETGVAYNMPVSSKDTERDRNSHMSGIKSDIHPDDESARLLSDLDISVLKKSKRRTARHVVSDSKERIVSVANKKGQSSRSGKTGKDSEDSAESAASRNADKSESVKPKRKCSNKKMRSELSLTGDLPSQELGKNRTLVLSPGFTEGTVQNQNRTSGESFEVHAPSSYSDQDKKQKKQQKLKEAHGLEQSAKCEGVNTLQLTVTENRTNAVQAATISGLELKETGPVRIQGVFSVDLSDGRNFKGSELSGMEVDDDVDDQPALVIEESEDVN